MQIYLFMRCIPNHATTTPSPIMPLPQTFKACTITRTWKTIKRYTNTTESANVTYLMLFL